MATTQMPPGFNPYQYMMQEDPDVAALKAAHAKAIADQQASLAAQKGYLGAESEFTPQTNLAPLLGLIDQWSGSKLAHNYQAPESGDQRLAKVAALEAGIRGQQNTLNADNLAQLKSAITEKKSDKNTLLRYMENQDKIQSNENLRDLIIKSNERIQKDKGQNVLDNTDSKNNGAVVIQKLKNSGVLDNTDSKNKAGVVIQNLKNTGAMGVQGLKNEKPVAGKNSAKGIGDAQVAEMAALAEQIPHIKKNLENYYEMAASPGSYLKGFIPNTDASKYDATALEHGTNWGKAMMGQARSHQMLMTHVSMWPTRKDSHDIAENKTKDLINATRAKWNAKYDSFKAAGKDMGNLKRWSENADSPYEEAAPAKPSREEMLRALTQ